MKPTDSAPESGLPSDLALRLHRLAVASTAESRPFPRLDTSIRRSRITRYGGLALACVVALAVIAVEVLAGGAIDRAGQPVPAAPSPKIVAALKQAGYGTTTSGSLRGDRAWLDAFAAQVRSATPEVPDDGVVQVVAAGDIEGRARFAVVLLQTTGASVAGPRNWTREIWLGAAGGPATAMRMVQSESGNAPGEIPVDPVAYFGKATDPRKLKDAVVVTAAPGADQVFVTSKKHLDLSDPGSYGGTSHNLRKTGPGIWAAAITPAEYSISEMAVNLAPIRSVTEAPGFDLSAVAPPGTDPTDLEWLTDRMDRDLKPTRTEVPVYAAAIPDRRKGQLVAALWRSPAGIYVYSLVEHDPAGSGPVRVWHGNGLRPAGAQPDAVMAGTRIEDGPAYRYLLLAPEGSTRVRVGKVTAAVSHRLAVVDVPDDGEEDGSTPSPAEFLDPNGTVIGRIRPVLGDGAATELQEDAVPRGDGTSVRP